MSKRLLIIGAGVTGLGAAHRLEQLGHADWSIHERNDYVGGLCASFRDDAGFTWDIGGHVVHSHYAEFDRFFAEMVGDDVYRHERRSFVRLAGRWVPYPFQANIRHLPDELMRACMEGLERAAADYPGEPDTTNLLRFSLSRFGPGITRLFFQPDNEKRWAAPLETLSAGWIADRVSPVDVERVRENIRFARDDVKWGPNNTFAFPRRGGTGAILEPMVKRLGDRLNLESEGVSIDPVARRVRFSDGTEKAYDALLSTMPLDILFERIEGAPPELVERASRLEHADGYIVGLGFSGPVDTDRCWVYTPEAPAPCFRITWFSNYSPQNAPDAAHHSIMCDISHSARRPVDRDGAIDDTIEGLVVTGVIAPEARDRIVSRYLIEAPYTYPVPTLDRDAVVAELHDWLEPHGIHARGRFGTWLYEIGNMDHCYMMGRQWAERMLGDGRESVWIDRG